MTQKEMEIVLKAYEIMCGIADKHKAEGRPMGKYIEFPIIGATYRLMLEVPYDLEAI